MLVLSFTEEARGCADYRGKKTAPIRGDKLDVTSCFLVSRRGNVEQFRYGFWVASGTRRRCQTARERGSWRFLFVAREDGWLKNEGPCRLHQKSIHPYKVDPGHLSATSKPLITFRTTFIRTRGADGGGGHCFHRKFFSKIGAYGSADGRTSN